MKSKVKLTITGNRRHLIKYIDAEGEDEKQLKDNAVLEWCNGYLVNGGMKPVNDVTIAKKMVKLNVKAEIL